MTAEMMQAALAEKNAEIARLKERVRVLELTQLELQHNVISIRKDECKATSKANMLEVIAMQGAEERNALRERVRVLEARNRALLVQSHGGLEVAFAEAVVGKILKDGKASP